MPLREPPSSDELRRVLAPRLGAGIAALVRRPSAYASSFALEELDVTLDDGRRLDLVFKRLEPAAMAAGARAAKPSSLVDPRREVEVYQRLLAPAALGTAELFAAVLDEAAGRSWLFLERVAGVELYQVGDRAAWERAARWLAAMHSALRELAGSAPRLLQQDAAYLRCWPRRAAEFTGHPDLVALVDRYEPVVALLRRLPHAVIHGEFYASNVLVAGPRRVCPVDWEMAAFAPALLDVAALVAGGWSEDDRRAIALAYGAALPPELALDQPTLLFALDACRLQLALQWLGWSPDWHAPEQHANDWLADALMLMDRLGL